MLTNKFLASAIATIALAGTIGVAIAQTTTQPAIGTGTTKSEVPGGRTTTGTSSTTTGTDSATTGTGSPASSRDTSMGTPSTGAGSTMSNEARARGDLN